MLLSGNYQKILCGGVLEVFMLGLHPSTIIPRHATGWTPKVCVHSQTSSSVRRQGGYKPADKKKKRKNRKI
ncbi:unnamed protein product [Taenia asiatica]|uniref:Uncharacterized protein n=1 Tax=Taenia asiatica TaxID=60517 RepID=A0A3P6P0F0_TAEAS|nr:unnamed protein product [Taenia asiatica]